MERSGLRVDLFYLKMSSLAKEAKVSLESVIGFFFFKKTYHFFEEKIE